MDPDPALDLRLDLKLYLYLNPQKMFAVCDAFRYQYFLYEKFKS
jgi:hypothetical protein